MHKLFPSLLTQADFRSFFFARSISRFGDHFSIVATALYATALPQPAFAISVLLIAQLIPQLLGPFAGIWVDRRSAKSIMLLADLARAIVFIALALLPVSLPIAAGLIACSSLFSTLFNPAGRSTLPKILPKENLKEANALLAIGNNAAMAVGPVLAGVLASISSEKILFLVNAFSFLVSAAFIIRLKEAFLVNKTIPKKKIRQELVTALRYQPFQIVASNLFLVALFGSFCHASLIFYNDQFLQGNEATFGMLHSAYSIGMLAFPALFLLTKNKLPTEWIILLSILLLSWATSTLALFSSVAFALIFRGLMGGGNGLLNVGNDTFIQSQVPSEDLGKVFGSVFFFPSLASILALLINPILLHYFKPEQIYFFSGWGTALAALPLIFYIQRHKNLAKT